jgi:proteasome lid subunit RPN8/RPN11
MMDAVLYNGDENDDDGQCLDTNASSRGSDAVSLAPDLDDWKECFLKMPYFVATSGNNSSTSRSSGGSYSSDDEKHAFEMGNEQQQQQQCGNYSKLLRGEVGVWDWSLKCHVKFDCFPSNCIPGTSLGTCRRGKNCNHCLMELDFDHIEQMAMDMFMNPTMEKVQLQSTVVEGNSKYNDNVNDVFSSSSTTSSSILDRTKQEEELVLAQWKAALMYWQHPAIHSLLVPNVTKSNVPLNSFMLLSNSFMDSAPIRSSSNGSVFGSNSGGGGSLWNDHYFTRVNFSTNGQTNASSSVSSSILMHDNVSIPATAMNASSFLKGTTDSMFSLRRASVNKFSGGFTSYLGNGSNSLGGGGGSVMEDMNRHISPTTHASWLQRKYEWQECFRSLFIRWMRRIKELKPPEWNGNNYSQDASLSSRCCFFSISSDRTVLFRPFRDISNKTGCFHPMIVVSSSTKQVRSCLRAMGVTIKIMLSKSCDEEEIQYKDLTEEFIHEWIESKKNKNEEVDEDMKSAREELKALRDATAQGQTVGADISISMFKRTSKRDILSKDNASFPPLLIIGHDDCMAFFELFTNTVGTLDVTTEDDTFKDVPLLITRFQGLNQYMTLRRLDSSIVRFPDDKQSEESTAVNQLSFVELHGPILPCAFQDLISASASHFSLHKKHLGETNQGCSVKRSNFTVDENILGSHYFMMHLINHGEPDIQDSDLVRGSSASLGSSGSFNFNGIGETCDDNQSAEDSNAGHERGKTTSTVVWDTNRPFSIAYKTSSTKQL